MRNRVIIICGPTAVGKTDFAIRLAELLETEIISADSRQCFVELNIGVAKPKKEQLDSIRHHFINSHSIHNNVNTSVFEAFALQAAESIFKKHPFVVMVGGTGLYIKTFCEGLDAIPLVNPAVRNSIVADYEAFGLSYLQKRVAQEDPVFWKIAEQQNPQRLMRALEVFLSTGKSITEFRTSNRQPRSFEIMKIGLALPRDLLYSQINQRVDNMLHAGLLDEAPDLFPHRHLNALQTVGYRELFDYFEGKFSAEKAIEAIKANTRQYAKRQMTWFKKDSEIEWHNAHEFYADDFLAMQIL